MERVGLLLLGAGEGLQRVDDLAAVVRFGCGREHGRGCVADGDQDHDDRGIGHGVLPLCQQCFTGPCLASSPGVRGWLWTRVLAGVGSPLLVMR